MYNSNDCNSDFYTNGKLTLLKSVVNNSKTIFMLVAILVNIQMNFSLIIIKKVTCN